jgi:hypothetical protein
MNERESIVAWLRGQADDVIGRLCGSSGRYDVAMADKDVELIENIANRIERGDHLK